MTFPPSTGLVRKTVTLPLSAFVNDGGGFGHAVLGTVPAGAILMAAGIRTTVPFDDSGPPVFQVIDSTNTSAWTDSSAAQATVTAAIAGAFPIQTIDISPEVGFGGNRSVFLGVVDPSGPGYTLWVQASPWNGDGTTGTIVAYYIYC